MAYAAHAPGSSPAWKEWERWRKEHVEKRDRVIDALRAQIAASEEEKNQAQKRTRIASSLSSRRGTMKTLIAVVAEAFRVDVIDIVSSRRTKAITPARHAAMALCRLYTTHSYPKIGRALGGRDHSTIIHGCDKVAAKMRAAGLEKTDDPRELAAALAALERP